MFRNCFDRHSYNPDMDAVLDRTMAGVRRDTNQDTIVDAALVLVLYRHSE